MLMKAGTITHTTFLIVIIYFHIRINVEGKINILFCSYGGGGGREGRGAVGKKRCGGGLLHNSLISRSCTLIVSTYFDNAICLLILRL